MKPIIKLKEIARVAHEANRAYCEAIGDPPLLPWDESPEWQRASVLMGVHNIAFGVVTEPGESHASWLRHKESEGWVYGAVKSESAKTHPCMVPFAELPFEQQLKDHLFVSVVSALLAAYRVV